VLWQALVVRPERDLRFVGDVVWLTPGQGSRRSGPPQTPPDEDFAATAYVPPASAEDGLASFVLRVRDQSSWRSPASADWLVVPNEGVHWIDQGAVVVVTEGATPVAYFHVREVLPVDH
jgi:hypothetical protein